MRYATMCRHLQAACAVGALALSFAATPGTALGADDKTYVMKITLPTIHDTLEQYSRNFAAAVEKDSGGRIKGEVYPASQLGAIARQIEGVQFGAIQAAVMPPEFYVGVDERFEIMAAPGLVNSFEHAVRVSQDASVQKLMLGLGAGKGLHGVGLFVASPSSVITRTGIRHLADFKGKKIRIFTSDFQSVAMQRLGATPIAMTLGDVLPAIQQGAIDGAIAGMPVYTTMHYQDAAKYVTETGQPYIFIVVEISAKWYDSLPQDLQAIIDADAVKEATAINPWAMDFYNKARTDWVKMGGELISLPPDEQSSMMETLASVAEDLSKPKPELNAAYQLVNGVAKRTR